MQKFIIQCQNVKCKKPILKENPNSKLSNGNFTWKGEHELINVSAVDIETKEPVILPNVWCKHCKHKNLITAKDLIDTSKMEPEDKKKLNTKIKDEVKKAKNEDGVIESF